MVVIANGNMKSTAANGRWVLSVTSLGLLFLIIPIVFIFVNPILMLATFQLRLANGTLLHELLKQEIEGARIDIYFFNITNPERFLSGDDHKLKVEEVGPFAYQEYRTNDDLELNVEPGIMRYTPNHRTEFLAEESYASPEDVQLVLPNVALLSALQILNKYPRFIGQLFRVLISGMNLTPLQRISAQNYLWNNTDPLIKIINSVVPGLIYYNSTGMLTRLYDPDAKYRLELGTTDQDKFQVKKVRKYRPDNKLASKTDTVFENTKSFSNAYEGAAFPPQLTPETPVSIYRYSICKTLKLRYAGTRMMEYGSAAFEYKFDNSTFEDRTLCNSKGWCPGGILDLSPCYFGFPFAISKGHFYDTDPKVYEKIEGLKPNRSIHSTSFLIDPKLGVTVGASMSAQLNLALGDMSLLKEARRLSDMFLPISSAFIKHPRLRKEARDSLQLMYTYGPYILLSGQILSALLGASLLVAAVRMRWRNRPVLEKQILCNKASVMSKQPLLYL